MNTRHQKTWMKKNGYVYRDNDETYFWKSVPYKDHFLTIDVFQFEKTPKTRRWHVSLCEEQAPRNSKLYGDAFFGEEFRVDGDTTVFDGNDIRKLDAHILKKIKEWELKA